MGSLLFFWGFCGTKSDARYKRRHQQLSLALHFCMKYQKKHALTILFLFQKPKMILSILGICHIAA